jgi:hypothetical protein
MIFIAYFVPEASLPVASIVAAALGFVMMMGRETIRLLARAIPGSFRVQPGKRGTGGSARQPQRAPGRTAVRNDTTQSISPQ